MKKLISGALAGLVATAPMSVVMEILHHWPRPEREPLPPYQITMISAEAVGLEKHLNKRGTRGLAALIVHFGYGGAAGAVYAPLATKVPGHPALKGIGFALLVWSVSYLGWVPAANILPPATEHSARRNILMIVAHLIWGAALGMLVQRWNEDRD